MKKRRRRVVIIIVINIIERSHLAHQEEFEQILRLLVIEVRLGLIGSVGGGFCRFSRNCEASRVHGSCIVAFEIAKAIAIRALLKSEVFGRSERRSDVVRLRELESSSISLS